MTKTRAEATRDTRDLSVVDLKALTHVGSPAR